MSQNQKLMKQVKTIMTERSKKPLELAKQAVLEEQFKYKPLGEAMQYFANEVLCDASHPTLLSLACEAVGGNPEKTIGIATALVLLTGAADVHDDIIDESETKESKPTIFGKFGRDMTIIAGNVLWIKGMSMLNEACQEFSTAKRQNILNLAKHAFFDIGSAEAKEVSLHGKIDLKPEEYLEMVGLKVSVAQAAAKIGAIIGDGTAGQVEVLGQYAKTLGVLMTIRDEFIDMFEPEELVNRFKNECLPLPILYAFQDAALKKKILKFINENEKTQAELDEIMELVYDAPKVRKLVEKMQLSVMEAAKSLQKIKQDTELLISLLTFSLQGLVP